MPGQMADALPHRPGEWWRLKAWGSKQLSFKYWARNPGEKDGVCGYSQVEMVVPLSCADGAARTLLD